MYNFTFEILGLNLEQPRTWVQPSSHRVSEWIITVFNQRWRVRFFVDILSKFRTQMQYFLI